MDSGTVRIGWPLAVVVVVLTALAVGVSAWARIGRPRDALTAAARAVVQLALVSTVILLVLRAWWSTALFLVAMVLVAAGTAARRVTGSLRPRSWLTALPIVTGLLPVLALLLAAGTLPGRPVALLPSAGILIGGGMTATSISGRRVLDELRTRRGEVEAMLSLGFSDADAVRELGRPVAAVALVPGLDQTRTVGLVTLPGAFVGVLLGGGTPLEAGATQLVVLVGLLVVQVAAVAVTVELIARGRLP